MAKCPECKARIYRLRRYMVSEGATDLVVVHGEPFETGVLPHEHIRDDYECPDCGEALFHDKDEAVKFLK